MNTLQKYLNSISVAEQVDYAKRCDTTLNYLRKTIYAKTKIGALTCIKLENESRGQVKKQELRPDIWTDLVEKVAA